MKPWSCASTACAPPAATAFFTISSTSERLFTLIANIAFVSDRASPIARLLKSANLSFVRSMKYASSPMSMQVAVASVNCGLKLKPSASKNSIERWRSFTGMLTNSLRGVVGVVPVFRMVGAVWVVVICLVSVKG
jgi:hypothetical protein